MGFIPCVLPDDNNEKEGTAMSDIGSKRIWIPVDFRGTSRKQIHLGIAFAQKTGAKLTLVHSVDIPDLHAHRADLDAVRQQALARATEAMAPLAGLARDAGVAVESEILVGSGPALLLKKMSEDPNALVIIGKGQQDNGQERLGYTASRLVRKAAGPVLVVDGRHTLPHPYPVRRILFPHDFSPHAAEGLRQAAALARQFDAMLEILHVIRTPIYMPVFPGETPVPIHIENMEEVEAATRKSLAEVAAALGTDYPPATTRLIISENIPKAIVDHAQEGGFDLLVLPSHGYGSLDQWVLKVIFLGSTTEKALQYGSVPALVLRPQPAKD